MTSKFTEFNIDDIGRNKGINLSDQIKDMSIPDKRTLIEELEYLFYSRRLDVAHLRNMHIDERTYLLPNPHPIIVNDDGLNDRITFLEMECSLLQNEKERFILNLRIEISKKQYGKPYPLDEKDKALLNSPYYKIIIDKTVLNTQNKIKTPSDELKELRKENKELRKENKELKQKLKR